MRPPHLAARRRRAAALAALLAGVAATAVAVLTALDGEGPRLPEGGSRFGASAPAAKRSGGSLLDALAPVLERGSGRARGHGAPAPGGLPLSRQVAQLFAVGFTGTEPPAGFIRRLRARGWGAVVIERGNFADPLQLATLTGTLAATGGEGGRPAPLIAAPQEGGEASAFPGLAPRAQAAIGATGRAALARAQARTAGTQLRALGIDLALAPTADVSASTGPVEGRAFGDDPAVVARLARAAVEGWRAAGIAPAVGHFPGIGAASQDPTDGPATVGLSLDELRARDLQPFAAVARRAPAIVVSGALYAAFDGVTPAALLPEIVGGLLRGDLRYRGVVVADDLVAAADTAGVHVGDAAIAALKAGADLLYVPGGLTEQDEAYAAVLRAVRRGEISRARLAASVRRILTLKRRFPLRPARPGTPLPGAPGLFAPAPPAAAPAPAP